MKSEISQVRNFAWHRIVGKSKNWISSLGKHVGNIKAEAPCSGLVETELSAKACNACCALQQT